jgi:hypothetical protein
VTETNLWPSRPEAWEIVLTPPGKALTTREHWRGLGIHDSIPVCCVQHQAFRRKIRHIIVSDPSRYGLCYGLTHCFHLKTLTVHVGKVDGVFLEKNLMSPQANRGGAQTQGQEAEIGDRAGRAAKVNCRGHG